MQTRIAGHGREFVEVLVTVWLLTVGAVSVPLASAASGTWDGSDSDMWQLNANWSGSSYPGSAVNETATFSSANGGHTTIDVGAGLSVQQVTFSTTAAAYTIGTGGAGNQAMALTAVETVSAIGMSSGPNDMVINANIQLAPSCRITNSDPDNTLTIAGGVTGSTQLRLVTTSSSTIIVSGNISGSGSVFKFANTGTIVLRGQSTFTGAFQTWNGGRIVLEAPEIPGVSGPLGQGGLAFDGGAVDGSSTYRPGILVYSACNQHDYSARVVASGHGISRVTVDTAGQNVTWSNALTNTEVHWIRKTGAGVWTLSGSNTYAGGTTIFEGTLLANNTAGSGTGTGAVTVKNGATLGGTGSISGPVVVEAGGTIQPTLAGPCGTLTIAGATAPSFASGSRLKIRVPGNATSDKVVLSHPTPVFSCGTMDLVVDTTNLGGEVMGVMIVRTTSASGIVGKFVSVSANNYYTATVHYNADSITLDLRPRIPVGTIFVFR